MRRNKLIEVSLGFFVEPQRARGYQKERKNRFPQYYIIFSRFIIRCLCLSEIC